MNDIIVASNNQYQRVTFEQLLNILTAEHDDLAVIFGAEHLHDKQKELLEIKKVD